jgi:transcription antitermination factor NusG
MRHPYLFKTRAGITPFVAADRLLRFGVMPMNPCVYEFLRKEKAGPVIVEARPQLPGYFCGFFDADKLWQVSQAGVLGRCMSPDHVMRPLKFETWQEIQAMTRISQEAPEIAPHGSLKPGMTVILRHGPFTGQRVRLQSTWSGGKKAKGLMELFGKMTEVSIEAGKVEIAA